MEDRLMTKGEVLKHLQITRGKFEELVKDEGLPCIRIGSYKRYVRLSHLNEWLDKKTLNLPSEVLETSTDEFEWKKIWG
ncbi:MAG: helix-turn-helix domain-containing protein [Bacteroidetes bacterium]|nr:helix-turn-helix domain-containing protein [Bacteroidota bacterium]